MVFADETRVRTNMTRTHGWATKGEPLAGKVPHGHRKTLTFIAGLRHGGIVAPCVPDSTISAVGFAAWVGQFLIPAPEPGRIVAAGSRVRTMLGRAGIKPFFLPPYSPDPNPSEKMFSMRKRLPRKASERTVKTTWQRIGKLPDRFPTKKCPDHITDAG